MNKILPYLDIVADIFYVIKPINSKLDTQRKAENKKAKLENKKTKSKAKKKREKVKNIFKSSKYTPLKK
ncbi:MAG: hypothetical protein EWV76_04840 [Microcystis novacekii Mn_MB_F_20050700_S1]|uniref:Transposase IS204/IS1001/IS1096/IS1165 DDE domain-containing protein n=1 Tax=Microcystis novacekii Mn_MB_F_20050700_S1D TaxID=2486266 RepID=A0A552IFP8_9CHRO|nr:MAG: hypothetical protein EWV54_21990 [Microcystis novacekii Mn_MB_F_20050700_S1D]TRU90857.1 MAG: hypothetical protein EWV76_04840 [Microcystis novacekii Mn_MB_F_20050700_S1]